MQVLSLVWGIVAILGLGIAFVPCLGWLNWLNIPFSLAGLIVSVIASSQAPADKKNTAIGGIVLCAFAAGFGLIRLALGGRYFLAPQPRYRGPAALATDYTG